MPVTRRAKRLFDLAIVVGTIPLTVPIGIAVAIAVRWKLGAPVLFRQTRPGLHERPFTMLKFRTMTDARDAEGRLLPDAERMPTFGQWLRATSLDELPELLNVLKGEMSLVGPRPLLMAYLDRYSEAERQRHSVPPGVTGWAQVQGRNATTWSQRFVDDLWYVEHASIGLDLKILARTLLKVVRRDGITAEGHATMPEYAGRNDFP